MAAEGRQTVAPQRLVTLARQLKRGEFDASTAGDLPWHCTGCGACQNHCHHDQDVPGLLLGARARMTEARTTPAGVREVSGNFAVAANPEGRSLSSEMEGLAENTQRRLQREPRAVFFPGCTALAHDPLAAEQVLRAASLLGDAELGLTPASATCCGGALLWAGDTEAFTVHAERVSQTFKGANLVVLDPICAQTMASHYERWGIVVTFTVQTAQDFVADRLPAGAERASLPNFGVLDGCGQRPRGQLLRDPVVLGAACCGAGGLFPQAAPEVAASMARAIQDEVRDRDLDGVVASGVRCRLHLRRSCPSMNVVDPLEMWVQS